MRKVLYNPNYRGGWTSRMQNDEMAKLAIDWPPLVAAVARGERVDKDHPAVKSLRDALLERGIEERVPYGGLRGIVVETIKDGPVRINEYDGCESLEFPDQGRWL